jgi:hypothetical protein
MIPEEQANEAKRIIREWAPMTGSIVINEHQLALLEKLADVMLDQFLNRTLETNDEVRGYILGFLCTAASIGYIDNNSDISNLVDELDLN